MHRFIVASAMTAIALLSPAWAEASNQETASRIAKALKQSGRLHDYAFDVKYKDGTTWLVGRVSSDEQKELATSLVKQMPDVARVINQLDVAPSPELPSRAPSPSKPVVRAVTRHESAAAETFEARPTYDAEVQVAAGQEEVAGEEEPARVLPLLRGHGKLRTAARRLVPQSATPAARGARPANEVELPQAAQAHRESTQPAPLPRHSQAAHSHATQTRTANVQAVPAIRRQVQRHESPAAEVAQGLPTYRGAPRGQSRSVAAAGQGQIQGQEGQGELRGPQGQAVRYIPVVQGPNGTLIPLSEAQATAATQQSEQPTARRRRPFGRFLTASRTSDAVAQPGPPDGPMPAYMPTSPAGAAPTVYDQPHMPNYAWPSYAAYPNYAGLTYPKQYSPTAWPYIGPFYPYPQVPLGWRKVSLEWDDGWWFLDFDDQN